MGSGYIVERWILLKIEAEVLTFGNRGTFSFSWILCSSISIRNLGFLLQFMFNLEP